MRCAQQAVLGASKFELVSFWGEQPPPEARDLSALGSQGFNSIRCFNVFNVYSFMGAGLEVLHSHSPCWTSVTRHNSVHRIG